MSDTERQIDDTIEQADQPAAGETPEPLATPGGGISGRPFSGLEQGDSTPSTEGGADAKETATESTAEPTAEESTGATEAAESTSSSEAAESPGSTDAADANETATESTAEPTADESTEPTREPGGDGSGGDDEWRTWSGRSVNP
jgi:hypothetical protein